MRGTTKIATAVTAAALAATLGACSSSGSGGGSNSAGNSAPASSSAAAPASSSAAPKPEGAFTTLTGKTTTVVPASSFTDALKSLKVTLGLVGKAKMTSQGIAFPITGGNATIYKKGDVTPYVQGTVVHNGSGISLSAGGTTVKLLNFVIDPGNNSKLTGSVDVNGKQAFPAGTKLFDLDGNTLQTPSISSAGVATLQGTTIYLSQAAAGALNMVFKLKGKTALPTTFEAVKVGTAIIKATGK